MATGVATGNISPSRFVKLSTTDGKITQSGAGERIAGVSQRGTRNTPLTGLDDGYAAIAGENCMYHSFNDGGDEWVLVEAGGTIARGDRLKSDSDGKAVATTSGGDEIGAEALGAATSGKLFPVRLLPNVKL